MDDGTSDGSRGTDRDAARRPVFRSALAARVLGLLLAAAIIAGAVIALHGRGSQPATSLGALDRKSPVSGQPAPDFSLGYLDGGSVRLSGLRGQVVLVNFWATWCIPCRQEMPAIAQVYAEQRGQGFTVLEVNEQETPADVETFVAQIAPTTPPVVLDGAGSVMRQYRFKGLPDSVVVDPQGTVRSISYGPLTRAALLRDIDDARAAAAR
jgi:cytochrome c biogenesis protein CcmG, thiol:disulfide interchange protein DsbE